MAEVIDRERMFELRRTARGGGGLGVFYGQKAWSQGDPYWDYWVAQGKLNGVNDMTDLREYRNFRSEIASGEVSPRLTNREPSLQVHLLDWIRPTFIAGSCIPVRSPV